MGSLLQCVGSATHGLSCSTVCGILVTRPGIEPMSPTFTGGFLTTGSPRKFYNAFSYGKKCIACMVEVFTLSLQEWYQQAAEWVGSGPDDSRGTRAGVTRRGGKRVKNWLASSREEKGSLTDKAECFSRNSILSRSLLGSNYVSDASCNVLPLWT